MKYEIVVRESCQTCSGCGEVYRLNQTTQLYQYIECPTCRGSGAKINYVPLLQALKELGIIEIEEES